MNRALKTGRILAVNFLMILLAGSIVLILRSYVDWLPSSDSLLLSETVVKGNDLVPREEIIKQAGLQGEKQLNRIDLRKVTMLIQTHPYIEAARVRKSYPHKLLIDVIEKKPIVLINVEGDLYSMDRDGLILPSQPNRTYNLPVLTGDFKGGVTVGTQASGPLLEKGLSLVRTLLECRPGLYEQISEIVLGPFDELKLYTQRGAVPVFFGSGEVEYKARCLEAALSRLDREGKLKETRYIDLRFYRQVIIGKRT